MDSFCVIHVKFNKLGEGGIRKETPAPHSHCNSTISKPPPRGPQDWPAIGIQTAEGEDGTTWPIFMWPGLGGPGVTSTCNTSLGKMESHLTAKEAGKNHLCMLRWEWEFGTLTCFWHMKHLQIPETQDLLPCHHSCRRTQVCLCHYTFIVQQAISYNTIKK